MLSAQFMNAESAISEEGLEMTIQLTWRTHALELIDWGI